MFALVLAAGRSRRFDGDKRKALLPCGRTLLTASLETAGKVFTQTGVVLRDLARLADPQRIALPMHEGQRGHPVIIGRRFWRQLLALEGDQGAKALIINNPALCDVMNCDDPGVLRDADTRSALAIACRQHLTAGRD
ncbi:hypothetical protein BKM03_16035 [Pseudomonas avellanae]|uniref:MobA-like NTP transferase domain-containing protein n=1 Tax=Pseudomonas avellanae TaxID=46257 RepID=A0AAD0GTY1_9PSED|nr:hypothetical protein BKM03_16035 [Pseudomonas avellanae]POP88780.1 hypothetical protein CXB34_01510 [Pseudomonas amygdali pv. morsprunorum]